MGKKKLRSKYTSKGERSANQKVSNAVRSDVTVVEKMLNKFEAFYAGKDPWITIENPNPLETNKRFIKVKARSLWGDPKKRNGFYIK